MMRTDAFPANDAAASLSGMPPRFLMSVRAASGCPQIRYFSMKKEWKDPRKAREYLDTISKNGYNNSVD